MSFAEHPPSLLKSNEAWRALPILKWPGGKRSLINQIAPHVGEIRGTYYEPFLGGAALFLAMNPRRAVLSDLNEDLVRFYNQIKRSPEEVIRALRQIVPGEVSYYEERSRDISCRTPEAAARFFYVVSHAFNGIYRQNLKGQFNVPYGHRTRASWPPEGAIREMSLRLQRAEILPGDFQKVIESARKGDVIYFDPPYTVAHNNNGFIKYNAHIFSWKDQERLARAAVLLSKRGCRVLISNADHPAVRELYAEFAEFRIERNSVIAASGAARRRITESLFVNMER